MELNAWTPSRYVDHPVHPSILLVEDDADIRDMISTLLSQIGYVVSAHAHAEAALHELRERHFDLILTDYALPRHTGTWLLQQAEAEGLIDATPAMIVTAHPHVDAPYEIIQKPFDLDELVDRVRQRMEQGDSRPRARRGQRRPAAEGHGTGGDDGQPECPDPVELILYVSRKSPRSYTALRNVREVLSRFDPSRVRLTVCDLSEDPLAGEDDAIAFTPTLVRKTPGPRTFILGHISNPELILELLADCQDREPG